MKPIIPIIRALLVSATVIGITVVCSRMQIFIDGEPNPIVDASIKTQIWITSVMGSIYLFGIRITKNPS